MDKKLKVQKNWRKIIILSTILFVVIILQDVSREIFVFQNDVEDLKTVLNDQLNNELMDEVEFRIDEIEAIINDSDLDYETHLIDELDDLGYVVEKTIEFYDGQSEEIILTQIGNSIKGFKDSDHSHKYYLMNMQGKLLYDGLLEQEVSIEQIDFSDDFNRFYIQEIIENLTTNPDTYAHIDSFFLEEDTTQLGYLAIKIKNSNYILYSVGDTREFQEEQLSYYYEQLSEYYNTNEGSLFVLNQDGTIILQKADYLIGTNYMDSSDQILKTAIQKIFDYSNAHLNGYIEIDFYSNLIDLDVTKRIVYIHTIEDLDLVVGYSVNANAYDDIIHDFEQTNIKSTMIVLIPLYLVIIILVSFIVRLIINNNSLSMQIFNEEEVLYKKFADITEDIIIISDKKGNIIFANELGLKTVFKNGELTALNLDDVMVDEEGYKTLIGITQNYYIKYTVSAVPYNGIDCDLYIMSDVTEKVTTERKLEAMTLSDDLTGLGNRRLMVRDYSEFILPTIKEGKKAYLAMIDLDNFKQANDDYGHTFGDDVLINISNIFKEHMTESVKIYRVGGDEFSLITTDTNENEMLKLLRKIKNKVSTYNYGKKVNVGLSAGVVEINVKDTQRRLSDYYEKADQMLYIAKQEGKDRIKI